MKLCLGDRVFHITPCSNQAKEQGLRIKEYFKGGRQKHLARVYSKAELDRCLAELKGPQRKSTDPSEAMQATDEEMAKAMAPFISDFYGALKNVGDFCFKSRVTASGGRGLVTATAVEAGSFIMYSGQIVSVVPSNATYVITAMPTDGCDVIVYDFLDPIGEPSLQTYGSIFFDGEELRAVKPMIIDGTYSKSMAILANDPTFPGSKLLDLEENAQLVAVLRRSKADGLLHVDGAALRTTCDLAAGVAVGVCYSRTKSE